MVGTLGRRYFCAGWSSDALPSPATYRRSPVLQTPSIVRTGRWVCGSVERSGRREYGKNTPIRTVAGENRRVQTEFSTGTVTFLFTDVEGSTRLLQVLGDRYADVLAEQARAASSRSHPARRRACEPAGVARTPARAPGQRAGVTAVWRDLGVLGHTRALERGAALPVSRHCAAIPAIWQDDLDEGKQWATSAGALAKGRAAARRGRAGAHACDGRDRPRPSARSVRGVVAARPSRGRLAVRSGI